MSNYHEQELLERLNRFNQGFGTINPIDRIISIYNDLMDQKGFQYLKNVFAANSSPLKYLNVAS